MYNTNIVFIIKVLVLTASYLLLNCTFNFLYTLQLVHMNLYMQVYNCTQRHAELNASTFWMNQ
jgi:hypothetical protein